MDDYSGIRRRRLQVSALMKDRQKARTESLNRALIDRYGVIKARELEKMIRRFM